MSDADALISAVAAEPDNDLPRLVYADWLDENGQPARAEFIRVQCRLAALPPGRRKGRNIPTRREHVLLTEFRHEWVQADWPGADSGKAVFERGFITNLSFAGFRPGDASVSAIAGNPLTKLLRILDLGASEITDVGIQALATTYYLGNLEFLDLRGTRLSSEAAFPLSRFPRLLCLLSLWGNCPVQAEGQIGPHPFYFRARHEAWSFGLSEDPAVDGSDVYVTTESQFVAEGDYGTTPFAAGYMPEADAITLIQRSAEEYRRLRGIA